MSSVNLSASQTNWANKQLNKEVCLVEDIEWAYFHLRYSHPPPKCSLTTHQITVYVFVNKLPFITKELLQFFPAFNLIKFDH